MWENYCNFAIAKFLIHKHMKKNFTRSFVHSFTLSLLHSFILALALISFPACEKNSGDPEVGTGTDTPVVDPNNPDNPADMISITAVRIGPFLYRFIANVPFATSSATVTWDITESNESTTRITSEQRNIDYQFKYPDKARITVTVYNDDNNGGLIAAGSQTIYIQVK